MMSMKTVEKQREDFQPGPMGGEGSVPPLAAARPGRLKKMIFAGAIVIGAIAVWSHHNAAQVQAMSQHNEQSTRIPINAASIVTSKPTAPPRTDVQTLFQQKAPAVAVTWTCGKSAGLVIDGSNYEAFTGDDFGNVRLLLVSSRWADVSIDGKPRRIWITRPDNGGGFSGGGSNTRGRAVDVPQIPGFSPGIPK